MSCELEVWTFGSSDSQIYCLPLRAARHKAHERAPIFRVDWKVLLLC